MPHIFPITALLVQRCFMTGQFVYGLPYESGRVQDLDNVPKKCQEELLKGSVNQE